MAWQFAPLISGAWPFLSTNISQGSVAMHLRGGEIIYYRFTTKSIGETILKIGQNLAKVGGQNIVALFSGHKCVNSCILHFLFVSLW